MLVAITIVVMLGFAGLALDYAYVRSAGQALQTAADAAALAGARIVRVDDPATQFAATRQAAVGIALSNATFKTPVQLDPNAENSPSGDIVVGRWDPEALVFTPDTEHPDAVRVTARRTEGSPGGPIELFFGGLFGVEFSEVSRSAVARADRNGEPLVLLLSEQVNALVMNGDTRIEALDGNVQVNSPAECAATLTSGVLTTQTLALTGTLCIAHGTLNATLREDAPPRPDPLAALPPPPFAGEPLPAIQGSGTYDPGYYDGVVMHGGTATLRPGVYVLGAQGIELHGSARLIGDAVLLYLPRPAHLELSGESFMEVTPQLDGTYAGVTIFQDRASCPPNMLSEHARLALTGTCYVPSGSFELRGKGGAPRAEVGQLIALGLELSGGSELTVTGFGLGSPGSPSAAWLAQ